MTQPPRESTPPGPHPPPPDGPPSGPMPQAPPPQGPPAQGFSQQGPPGAPPNGPWPGGPASQAQNPSGPGRSQRSEGRSIFLTIVTGLGLAGVGMVVAVVLAMVIGIFIVEHMHGGSNHPTPDTSQVSSTQSGSTQDPQPTSGQSAPTYPGLTPGNGTLTATKIPTN